MLIFRRNLKNKKRLDQYRSIGSLTRYLWHIFHKQLQKDADKYLASVPGEKYVAFFLVMQNSYNG